MLVIGDSIMASTATRYTGYMCDELVPLGWAVEVEAEPSRFVDFGNIVLNSRLRPERGEDYDWDAAVVHLGSNYSANQERFEAELRLILTRLAPRPTLLFTVTEYKPSYAQANESIRKLAEEFDNVTLLDWEQVSKYPDVLSGDRLHPTDAGRHVLVDMVAEALGPATLGEGECLKSQLTDDSAANRGGSNGPASNPTGGGSSGSGTTATTVRPTTTTPGGSGGTPSTTTPVAAEVAARTTVPGTTSPPTTAPSPYVAAHDRGTDHPGHRSAGHRRPRPLHRRPQPTPTPVPPDGGVTPGG